MLWESSLKPVIELMLTLYHKRPKGRNILQHPTPSAAFAHAYFNSIASYFNLSEKQKHKAQATIDNGRKCNGTLLFTQPSTSAPLPTTALAPAYAPHAMGTTRGTTRRKEADDDGGTAVLRLCMDSKKICGGV